jgi:hypothetical protein
MFIIGVMVNILGQNILFKTYQIPSFLVGEVAASILVPLSRCLANNASIRVTGKSELTV